MSGCCLDAIVSGKPKGRTLLRLEGVQTERDVPLFSEYWQGNDDSYVPCRPVQLIDSFLRRQRMPVDTKCFLLEHYLRPVFGRQNMYQVSIIKCASVKCAHRVLSDSPLPNDAEVLSIWFLELLCRSFLTSQHILIVLLAQGVDCTEGGGTIGALRIKEGYWRATLETNNVRECSNEVWWE